MKTSTFPADQDSSTAVREGSMATIILYPQDIKYTLHKAVLVEKSEYFYKALTGPWREAEELTVKLDEVEENTFEIFVDWIYTKRLPDSHRGWHESRAREAVELSMLQAYAFGDQYQIRAFKTAVFQEILQYFNKMSYSTPYYRTVVYAFDHLRDEDILLELLVDMQCGRFSGSESSAREKQDLAKLPQRFLVRVMMQYSARGTRKWGIDEKKFKVENSAG